MNSDISIFIAFTAGLLSFLSPCILPLIPTYITFLLGDYADQSIKKNKYSLLPVFIFIAGFTLIFVLMGITASYIGRLLLENQVLLRKISGLIIIILGIHLSGFINLNFFNFTPKFNIPKGFNKYLRALIMGLGLAITWTPCVGPVLQTILIYSANIGQITTGALLLTVYSMGMALPFIITAIFFSKITSVLKKTNTYLPLIKKICGILIIILGIMIYFNYLNIIQYQAL